MANPRLYPLVLLRERVMYCVTVRLLYCCVRLAVLEWPPFMRRVFRPSLM